MVSNRSVATYIKELILEPLDTDLSFEPGDYIQVEIPPYDHIHFRDLDIPEPYRTVWARQHVTDLIARNPAGSHRRNNYSIASNGASEKGLIRLNVRIATPPPGQDCPPGVGSAYMFNLRPNDVVTAIGPFGDFHIHRTQREMVYIGGGAGMAPLRAHLSHLFETEGSHRKVSFWYGARSKQEVFYADYFIRLAEQHPSFSFHLALSSPLPEDTWDGDVGLVHEIVFDRYLRDHPDPQGIEFYLCVPPMMIKACTTMLNELGVPTNRVAYDEF